MPVVNVQTAPTGDAHALLAGLAAQVAGVPVRVAHACAECGSDRHGRVVLLGASLFGSLSRADGVDVAAVTDAGPLGVDVEREGAAGPDVAAVLGIDAGIDDGDVTRAWVRTEALLKATGRGLALDPREIRLDGTRVVRGPQALARDVDLGPGLVAAVAVLGASGRLDVRGPQITGSAGSGAR